MVNLPLAMIMSYRNKGRSGVQCPARRARGPSRRADPTHAARSSSTAATLYRLGACSPPSPARGSRSLG